MILLTRLKGETFALNSDLIERVEVTPDTVITMVDGTKKYVVVESIDEVIAKVADFKASVLRLAASPEAPPPRQEHLHLVRDRDTRDGGAGEPASGPMGSGGDTP